MGGVEASKRKISSSYLAISRRTPHKGTFGRRHTLGGGDMSEMRMALLGRGEAVPSFNIETVEGLRIKGTTSTTAGD